MIKILFKKIIHKISPFHHLKIHCQAQRFYRYLLSIKKDDEIFLCVSTYIGDCIFSLSYMNAVHAKWPNKKIVVYVNGKQPIIKSYPYIDEVRPILSGEKQQEFNAFIQSSLVSEKGFKSDVYSVNPFFLHYSKHAKNKTALYVIKNHIFQLPKSAVFQYHSFVENNVSSPIPDFDKKKNRIAVLNPYSNSLNRFTASYYEKIAEILKQQGYLVYTNTIKDQTPIKGTEKLNCSLPELYFICTKIPLIVSIRSGVLDYLAPTNINMFVLYELNGFNFFYKCNDLNQWKTRGKIEQIVFRNNYLFSLDKRLDFLSEKLNSFLLEVKATR